MIKPWYVLLGVAGVGALALFALEKSAAAATTPASPPPPQSLSNTERVAALRAISGRSVAQALFPPDPKEVVWGAYTPPTDGSLPFQKVMRVEPLPASADAAAAHSLLQALLGINAEQTILATKDGKYVTAALPTSHIIGDYAYQGGPWFILAGPGELASIAAQAGL